MSETNVEILTEAGIIDPEKELNQDQIDAINSLSTAEVNGLISSRGKLSPYISDEDEIFVWPGCANN